MSFITLEKKRTGGRTNDRRASVSFVKRSYAVGDITISAILAEQLGWKRGDKVSLAMGSGNDRGTLRIVRTAGDGYALAVNGGSSSTSASVKFTFSHINPEVKVFARTDLPHSIVGGCLYVKLPEILLSQPEADGGTVYYRNGSEQRVSA